MDKREENKKTKLYALLKNSSAFRGIPDEKMPELIQSLGGYFKKYSKNEIVRNGGEKLTELGIVLKGSLQASMANLEKDQIIERFMPGETFAEAAVFSDQISPVEIKAVENTTIVFLPASAILNGYDNPDIAKLGMNLLQETSKKTLKLSMKIRILKEKRIGVRLMMYLKTLTPDENGIRTLPFNKTELAQFLGANRSSLSRELASAQEKGMIEITGKKIKVNPMVWMVLQEELA